MTPQEEQLAMQAYVRQQLLARQGQQPQLNLDPGQMPLGPEDRDQLLQRPPLAGDVEMPPADPGAAAFANNIAPDVARGGAGPQLGTGQTNIAPEPIGGPSQGQLPLQLRGGGYSMGKRLGQTSQPLSVQGGYNLPDLPIGVSGGTSLRPGRGLGGVDLRAYVKQPF